MLLSRRLLFTLPISMVNPNSTQHTNIKPIPNIPNIAKTQVITMPIHQFRVSEQVSDQVSDIVKPMEPKPNEKIVVLSDINDVKFFNHCAAIFELYHDEYNTYNQYKKDQYVKYKNTLAEAYDNSASLIESEELKKFVREQDMSSFENVCNVYECV